MSSPSAKKARMEGDAPEAPMDVDASTSATGHSPFEELPKELLFKVLDYAPEKALMLRMTSHAVQRAIEDFAVAQPTIVVEQLSLSGKIIGLPESTTKDTQLDIYFKIAKDRVGLFYLRLFLNNQRDFKEEIRRLEDGDKPAEGERLIENWDNFDVRVDVDDKDNCAAVMEKLREYVGRRIAKVQFFSTFDKRVQDACTTFLADKTFPKLDVMMDQLDVDLTELTVKITKNNLVQHVKMYGRFETKIDTVNLLRKLAGYLKGIYLYQTPLTNTTDQSTKKQLFGTDGADWAEIILELLAKENTLSKFCICNNWYTEYLTDSATARLLDELPRLDKQIWFMATCNQYPQGYKNDSKKNYKVTINAIPRPAAGAAAGGQGATKHKQFLEVKHITRVNEKPYSEHEMVIENK